MRPLTLIPATVVAAAAAVATWRRFKRRAPDLKRLAREDPVAFIKSLPLFRGLTLEQARTLLTQVELIDASPGQVLIREGEPGTCLYIVQVGELRITRQTMSGEQVVRDVKVGAIVGEMALLSGEPRTASAVVITPAKLFRLDRQRFERLREGNPALHATVWQLYAWHQFDNFFHAKAGRGVIKAGERQRWFSQHFSQSYAMDTTFYVPKGAHFLFLLTGQLAINDAVVRAPEILPLHKVSQLKSLRTSHVVWLPANRTADEVFK